MLEKVDKLEIYDVLSVLVPGVLVVCVVPLTSPAVAAAIAAVKLPGEFAFLGLLALSVFAGYLVQALASITEPVLNKTWGGRPSELALDGKLPDRYFPADSAKRIRAKLAALAQSSASTRSLFLIAMQRAEACSSTRVTRFNGLYAYHRALVLLTTVSILLFLLSFREGLAAQLTWKQNSTILVLLALLLVLFWHRTRQRGFYYVREVLLCAEQHLPSVQTSGAAEGS